MVVGGGKVFSIWGSSLRVKLMSPTPEMVTFSFLVITAGTQPQCESSFRSHTWAPNSILKTSWWGWLRRPLLQNAFNSLFWSAPRSLVSIVIRPLNRCRRFQDFFSVLVGIRLWPSSEETIVGAVLLSVVFVSGLTPELTLCHGWLYRYTELFKYHNVWISFHMTRLVTFAHFGFWGIARVVFELRYLWNQSSPLNTHKQQQWIL